jgi:hypothetical protein|tara:strand:+ start:759 stop:947 length:189 start_codon:yes stop_codon:yes gene_type:complete
MNVLLKDSSLDVYATPTSYVDLMHYIDKFSAGEKMAAMVSAHMAWNLACSIAKDEFEGGNNE